MTRHIADVTMFWSPAGGGVRRYVATKRQWLQTRAGWIHSAVVPCLSQRASRAPSAPALRDVQPVEVGVPSLPLPFAPGYRVARSRRRAAEVLCRLAPDLIEAGDPYNLAWAALDAAQALRVPALAFVHSDLPALAARVGGLRAERLAWRYLARLYPRFDLVLAPSAALCARLRAAGVRAQRQPLGVDCLRFTPAARDVAWRSEIGAAPEQKIVLYAGRLAPEKNLPTLLAAVERLGPRWLLVLIGEGPVRLDGPQLRRLPFERDQTRLARALASCDVFAHAGDIETFGLAPLEAMACGTPVVARAAGGLAELVDDEVGAAVERDDAACFAEAIDAVARRDREPLAAAARRRACAHDWPRVFAQLAARYDALLARDARSAQATQRLEQLLEVPG